MDFDNKISSILKQYVSIEEKEMEILLTCIKDEIPSFSIEESKNEMLKKLKNRELHNQASKLIKDELDMFEEDLLLLSRKIAEREGEVNIITKAHVEKAREFLWKRKSKYDFSDGLLGIGGLLTGTCIPHIIELADISKHTTASLTLIIIGIVGSFLFGIGIVLKANK